MVLLKNYIIVDLHFYTLIIFIYFYNFGDSLHVKTITIFFIVLVFFL